MCLLPQQTDAPLQIVPSLWVDSVTDDPAQVRINVGSWFIPFFMNTPINCHPMNPLPSISSNIADLFTRPLPTTPHHQCVSLVGDIPTALLTSVVFTVHSVTAASAVVDCCSATTAASASDSVPTLHLNLALAPTLPIALDTGASFAISPSKSDFLPVSQAPFGLIRSPILIVSKVFASTPVDPHTLITGEDAVSAIDLSSTDLSIADSDFTFAKVCFDIRQFGTSTLTFVFSTNLNLIKVFVSPTQVDWIHWSLFQG